MMKAKLRRLLLVGCSGSTAVAGGREIVAPAAQFPDGILSIEIRDDGLLGDLKQVTSWPAASYAALDEPNRRLFVLSSLTGDQSSRLGSYAYDQEGMLRELGDETVEGREACHLCVDPLGRYVLSAHFSSGTLAVNPIDENVLGSDRTSREDR